MFFAEVWNDYIVKHYKQNYHKPEVIVQADWENFLSEWFGYSKLKGEIQPHKTITIGSKKHPIPDIVVGFDDEDIIDFELKKYSLPLSNEMEQQLKSYMDLLHVSIGVLVCQKLYVYVYNHTQKKSKRIAIDFTEDNPDGIRFVELFQKKNFSSKAIETFIDSKNEFQNNVQKIKTEITADLVMDLLTTYLQTTYSNEEIVTAMNGVCVSVESKLESVSISPKEVVFPCIEEDQEIYTEPSFDYAIVKTKLEMVKEKGSLYEATRGDWKPKGITQFFVVLSVIDKIVREVYIVDKWEKIVYPNGVRWRFAGKVAVGEEYRKIVGKRIPKKFFKKGLASPVLYSTQKD